MKDGDKLIFIVSQPRSGSTMLHKLISNHEEVATYSEPWLLLQLSGLYTNKLSSAVFNEQVSFDAYEEFLNTLNIDKYSLVREVSSKIYEEALNSEKYFLDKTPRYYEILEFLPLIYPNAKYLVLKRHPGDVLNSMIHTWGNGKLKLENLYSYQRDYMLAPTLIHEFSKNHHAYTIHYENLVKNLENELRDIFSWLGLTYKQELVHLDRNTKLVGSYGDNAYSHNRLKEYERRPVDKSIGKWEKSNPEIKSFIESYLDFLGTDFLDQYGYREFTKSSNDMTFNRLNTLIGWERQKGNAFQEIMRVTKKSLWKYF